MNNNMYTNSGYSNTGYSDSGSNSSDGWGCLFSFLFFPFKIIYWFLLLVQKLCLITFVICAVLYFTNDSFHAYANDWYRYHKAVLVLSYSVLDDKDGPSPYFKLAAANLADEAMIEWENEKWRKMPVAKGGYFPVVSFHNMLDRTLDKTVEAVNYGNGGFFYIYGCYSSSIGIGKKDIPTHSFGSLTHGCRFKVQVVPSDGMFEKSKWKVLEVRDVYYKPEGGEQKARKLLENYLFREDR